MLNCPEDDYYLLQFHYQLTFAECNYLVRILTGTQAYADTLKPVRLSFYNTKKYNYYTLAAPSHNRKIPFRKGKLVN